MGDRTRLARAIVRSPSAWQRCLHGGETLLREEVFEAILKKDGEKSAFRYAFCGLGDRLVKDANGVHVAPMGCGHRLCPRCGRTKGRPIVKRIFGWLAAEAHGDIFAMVLTQRCDPTETVPQARARMVPKEKRYLDAMKDKGLISGALVTHPVWSTGSKGWHYHVHLLLELPGGEWTVDDVKALYVEVAGDEEVQVDGRCCELKASAGPADPGLGTDSGDPDFWTERSSGLAKAVQYPVRDIAQGISAKRVGVDRAKVAECVDALLNQAKGWKLRRTFGKWRRPAPPLPVAPVDEKPESSANAAVCPGKSCVVFGTVHRVARLAAHGCYESRLVIIALEESCHNDTDFGKRFVAFCRAAAPRGVT